MPTSTTPEKPYAVLNEPTTIDLRDAICLQAANFLNTTPDDDDWISVHPSLASWFDKPPPTLVEMDQTPFHKLPTVIHSRAGFEYLGLTPKFAAECWADWEGHVKQSRHTAGADHLPLFLCHIVTRMENSNSRRQEERFCHGVERPIDPTLRTDIPINPADFEAYMADVFGLRPDAAWIVYHVVIDPQLQRELNLIDPQLQHELNLIDAPKNEQPLKALRLAVPVWLVAKAVLQPRYELLLRVEEASRARGEKFDWPGDAKLLELVQAIPAELGPVKAKKAPRDKAGWKRDVAAAAGRLGEVDPLIADKMKAVVAKLEQQQQLQQRRQLQWQARRQARLQQDQRRVQKQAQKEQQRAFEQKINQQLAQQLAQQPDQQPDQQWAQQPYQQWDQQQVQQPDDQWAQQQPDPQPDQQLVQQWAQQPDQQLAQQWAQQQPPQKPQQQPPQQPQQQPQQPARQLAQKRSRRLIEMLAQKLADQQEPHPQPRQPQQAAVPSGSWTYFGDEEARNFFNNVANAGTAAAQEQGVETPGKKRKRRQEESEQEVARKRGPVPQQQAGRPFPVRGDAGSSSYVSPYGPRGEGGPNSHRDPPFADVSALDPRLREQQSPLYQAFPMGNQFAQENGQYYPNLAEEPPMASFSYDQQDGQGLPPAQNAPIFGFPWNQPNGMGLALAQQPPCPPQSPPQSPRQSPQQPPSQPTTTTTTQSTTTTSSPHTTTTATSSTSMTPSPPPAAAAAPPSDQPHDPSQPGSPQQQSDDDDDDDDDADDGLFTGEAWSDPMVNDAAANPLDHLPPREGASLLDDAAAAAAAANPFDHLPPLAGANPAGGDGEQRLTGVAAWGAGDGEFNWESLVGNGSSLFEDSPKFD